MAQTRHIHSGFSKPWIDYDRHFWQRRITMTDSAAIGVIGTTVVLLALASPAAYLIFNRAIIGIWEYWERIHDEHLDARRPDSGSTVAPVEQTSLLGRAEHISYYPEIRKKWKCARTPDFALIELGRLGWKMVTHHPVSDNDTGFKWSNVWARKFEILLSVFLWLVCVGIFGLLAWGSVASAGVISDAVALSSSDTCGFWIPDPRARHRVNGTYGHLYLQEVEAMEYAKNCYGSVKGADGCNFFVTRDIPIKEAKDNDLCPFSEDLCLGGRFSAFTLTTELISSKLLGINVPTGYKFNRTTTCAPIKTKGMVTENKDSYKYNYGAYGVNNWTWTAPKGQIKTFPGYDVVTFCFQEGSPVDWEPLPEFHSQDYDVTSLLLIQSRNNYHKTPRNDPIFPAKSRVDPPIRPYPLFYNNNPVSTALACVDRVSVCDAGGTVCWENINKPKKELSSHIEKTGYYMLDIALMRSNVCNSIILRGGSALDAQSKLQANLSVPLSLPLAAEQWKVEVRALFEASLARIQIDLRDYIRGAAANEIGFEDHIDSAYTDMCSTYKFRTVGWTNINAWAFWLLIILVIAVYILSIDQKWVSKEPKLIAESLWDVTVVLLVSRLYWKLVSQKRIADNVNQDSGVNGTSSTAAESVGADSSSHVVGDDESEILEG